MEKQEPTEPCKSCPYAEWIEMYGVMRYGCNMMQCTLALMEEKQGM